MGGLRKELSVANLVIIGIVGAVGTGVLFSNAAMAADAGPGVILAWVIGFVMYLPLTLTYVETAVAYPEAGGPSRYSAHTHGRTTNIINAFANLIWYLFIPPIEALATAEGLNYFYPHLVNATTGNPTTLGAILGVVFMLFFLPFNYYGIKGFGQSTRWLGLVKLVLYVAAAIGFITVFRTVNFFHFGGFMPFGMSGVFIAIPLAMFSYGGIRVIPDFAEEMKEPKRIGRALVWALIGQTVLNLLFAFGFMLALNWHQLKLPVGNWSDVTHIAGNPFLVIASSANLHWLIAVTLVVAIVGPFVTGYIYQGGGSRTLFAMGRTGVVSQKLKELNERYAIPFWALLVFTIVGAIVAYIAAPLPSIYGLIGDAVVAGYLGYAINPVVMLSLRRAGHSGLYKAGSLIAGSAFAFASLIVYWSGWPSVPYATVLLAVASLAFGLWYKIDALRNAIWYIAYIVFLVGMTYIGGVGSLTLVSMPVGSAIVVVVSVAVFLPWGVASRLPALRQEPVAAIGEAVSS